MKKLTKKEMYGMLLGMESVAANEVLVEFITKEVEAIEKKAEKSKAYKRAKKADELKDAVATCLGADEYRITSDILSDLVSDYEDLSSAKITARLTALVKDGIAEKQEVKVDGGRKLMGYKLVG